MRKGFGNELLFLLGMGEYGIHLTAAPALKLQRRRKESK